MATNKGASVGKAGEKAFEHLCAEAEIICNKSDDDQAGWDYFIQLDLNQEYSGSLDKRDSSLGAFVQVKSSLARLASVRLKLSNAERMITEPRPTFFAIYHINHDRKVISLRFAHVGEAAMIYILKSLRNVEKSKSNSTHRIEIHIPINLLDIREIPSTDGFSTVLKEYLEKGVSKYVRQKLDFVETSGYEENAYSGSFSLPKSETGKLISLLLEEVAEIEVKNFRIKEKRFGIEKDLTFATKAKISIKPVAYNRINLGFEHKELGLRAHFDCDFLAPNFPGLDREDFRAIIRNDVFSFHVDEKNGVHNWTTKFDLDARAEWEKTKNIVSLIEMCKVGNFEIKCYSQGKNILSVSASRSGNIPKSTKDIKNAFDCLDELNQNASFSYHAKISPTDFYRSLNNSRAVFYLISEMKDVFINVTIDSTPTKAHESGILVYPLILFANGGFLAVPLIVSAQTEIDRKFVRGKNISIAFEDAIWAESHIKLIHNLKRFAKEFLDRHKEDDDAFIIIEESMTVKRKKKSHLLSEKSKGKISKILN